MRLPSFQISGVLSVFESMNVHSRLRPLMDRISAALSSTRPRVHYVYYFIAAFDVLAVALGLYLASHTGKMFRTTVEANSGWHQLHEKVARLRNSIGSLYEPGKAVFQSREPEQEIIQFKKASAAFKPALVAVRKEAAPLLPTGDKQEVFSKLDYLELTASNIVVRTKILLSLYKMGHFDDAGVEMALADRHYSKSLKYIDSVTQQLHAVEAKINRDNLEHSDYMRSVEIIIVIMLVVMVFSVTAYGHFVGATIERKYAEVDGLNRRFDATLRQLPHGVSWFDEDRRLIICNEMYRNIFNLPERLTLAGTRHEDILSHCRNESKRLNDYATTFFNGLSQHPNQRTPWQQTSELADGRAISVAHIPTSEGGYLQTFTDTTEMARLQKKIAYQARHDALSGLLNRHGFNEEVEKVLALMKRGQAFAIHYLDLDQFKQVNDTLGHPVGDSLLKDVANRLRLCAREVDVIARIGGDEFAIIQVLSDLPNGAKAMAERLIQEIEKPFDIDGHSISVGTSIGIVTAPADGTDIGTLLKNADLALYRAKGDGRGVFRFFEADMDAKAQARRGMELDLRQAIAAQQFELHYQPLVESANGRTKAFEALLRWNHPQRGVISPMEFIPLAEEIGLMSKIGSWVISQACKEAKNWPEDVGVAVNVSATQFRDQTVENSIIEALETSGLAPHRLEVEITESVLLEGVEQTQAILARIRELGVKLALDDFGTGYSSLSYLKDFPFDKVKIDRSFIQASNESQSGALTIIKAIIGMSSNLGMRTAAEGIETVDQLKRLTAEGCSELQGYYFSKPVPGHRVLDVLSKDQDDQVSSVAKCA